MYNTFFSNVTYTLRMMLAFHTCNFAARSIAISHIAYDPKSASLRTTFIRRKTYLNGLSPLSVQIPPLNPHPHIIHNDRPFAAIHEDPEATTSAHPPSV
jgi:hypothetical protein